MNDVIFKINFEKAYDKVKWSFVQQTLRMKGFSQKWCDCIASFIQWGHVGIKVKEKVHRMSLNLSSGLKNVLEPQNQICGVP